MQMGHTYFMNVYDCIKLFLYMARASVSKKHKFIKLY